MNNLPLQPKQSSPSSSTQLPSQSWSIDSSKITTIFTNKVDLPKMFFLWALPIHSWDPFSKSSMFTTFISNTSMSGENKLQVITYLIKEKKFYLSQEELNLAYEL
jgi:hypothetical protein